jgi:hypothetical protein
MKRIHLFEFTDQNWYPQIFRKIQTDYLHYITTLGSGHSNLIPFITRAMKSAGTSEIVDLCSGGSGPWMHLHEQLEQSGLPVNVTLTDRFPNLSALQGCAPTTRGYLRYHPEPVDAMRVPSHLTGMRTMLEGFHHFKPEQAKGILQDAINKRAAIGVFEAGLKSPFQIPLLLLSPLTTLAGYIFITPFIKPRRLSRFVWTYLIPIVPLVTVWDGIVSFLRTYSIQDLRTMTASIPCENYTWEIGEASIGTPVFTFIYLIGYPVQTDAGV